ncbi:hypothetical protein Gotur_027945 [Gossypium turneri]
MEKGIQPRAKMLMQFMMHVMNSRWSGCLIHKSFLHSSLGQTPMIPFPMVNLLPLKIKDPGIQFMTGLKWFRIIVIQGCRIRSNEAKDQILSSLGKDSLSGISHLILHLQGFIVRLDECCFSLCTVWYIEQMTLEKYDIRKWYIRGHLIMGKDFDTLCYASYGKYYYMTLNPKPIGFGVSPSFKRSIQVP